MYVYVYVNIHTYIHTCIQVLYNQRTMEMKGKISRAHVALGAVVFCSVITVGIAGKIIL